MGGPFLTNVFINFATYFDFFKKWNFLKHTILLQ